MYIKLAVLLKCEEAFFIFEQREVGISDSGVIQKYKSIKSKRLLLIAKKSLQFTNLLKSLSRLKSTLYGSKMDE